MDCQPSSSRVSGAVSFRLAAGVGVLLLCALGLLSSRSIDWFLVKRSLRNRFSDIQWITTAELADWLAARDRPQPVLLDVRTRAEWQVSHLPGARWVDPKTDPRSAAGAARRKMHRSSPIVRSAIARRKAARELRAAGYTQCKISKARFSSGPMNIARWCMTENASRRCIRTARPGVTCSSRRLR